MLLGRLRDPFINHRHRRLFHVLRVSLALAITFAIIQVLPFEHSGWALVSTAMVMGNLPHIGGVLDKGRQRLAGTILGATLGLALIMLHLPPWGIYLGALLGIATCTWVVFPGRQAYSGLMFSVSLLLVIGDGNQAFSVALWRATDVLLGTLVGIAATVLFLPQKATDLMRFMLADCLDGMAQLYHAHTSATSAPDLDTRNLLKSTSRLLVKQRGLSDATREGHSCINAMKGLREQQHTLARGLGTLALKVRTGQSIDFSITPFVLQPFAELAMSARGKDERVLFSPSGYLWLNRELARLAIATAERLGRLERLPSKRLHNRAQRRGLLRTTPYDNKEGNQDGNSPH
jgi:uncharacterized membrane protein YccC